MTTQREKIIKEIQEKGFLNSYYATYVLGIKQAPTRVHEIKKMGYDIQSRPSSKHDNSVDWYFGRGSDVHPNTPEQKTLSVEDFIWKDGTAIPRREPEQLSL